MEIKTVSDTALCLQTGCGTIFFQCAERYYMPWLNGDYPPSYKNLPVAVREKAVEIANALLKEEKFLRAKR